MLTFVDSHSIDTIIALQAAIAGGTSHVRFTRNTLRCTGTGPYLTVAGDHAATDYNRLRDKRTLGNMINVTSTGSQSRRGAPAWPRSVPPCAS